MNNMHCFIQRIKVFLERYPLHFLLLCFFFVLHGRNEHPIVIPHDMVFSLTGWYLLSGIILLIPACLLYKDNLKAALLCFLLLSINFFFQSLHDFLASIPVLKILSRFRIYIVLSGIVIVVVAIALKRTATNLRKLSMVLNIVCLVLVLIELLRYAMQPGVSSFSTASIPSSSQAIPSGSNKPDIYLLLFDEYASSASLKERFHYDNSSFDSFLTGKGFHIIPGSHSNYNFTAFSISSMLNMGYINTTGNDSVITFEQFVYREQEIRKNVVCNWLSEYGYEIVNNSVFDIEHTRFLCKEPFLPVKPLITYQTFTSYFRREIFTALCGNTQNRLVKKNMDIYGHFFDNETILKATIKETERKSIRPRFVYCHMTMPHVPAYYDINGRLKTTQVIIKESKEHSLKAYLDYLPYTNKAVQQIINSIFLHAGKDVVILFMGDHGYRQDVIERRHYFSNYNAVYIPGNKWEHFYDSMSNVNQFSILFNTLFNTSFPLQKDHTYYWHRQVSSKYTAY